MVVQVILYNPGGSPLRFVGEQARRVVFAIPLGDFEYEWKQNRFGGEVSWASLKMGLLLVCFPVALTKHPTLAGSQPGILRFPVFGNPQNRFIQPTPVIPYIAQIARGFTSWNSPGLSEFPFRRRGAFLRSSAGIRTHALLEGAQSKIRKRAQCDEHLDTLRLVARLC